MLAARNYFPPFNLSDLLFSFMVSAICIIFSQNFDSWKITKFETKFIFLKFQLFKSNYFFGQFKKSEKFDCILILVNFIIIWPGFERVMSWP
jgi:hypothetical protein